VAPLPASNPLIVRANVNRREEKSSDYFSVYANDVQLQTTPWDMRLTLGVISSLPTDDVGPVTVTQLGELRISLQLAKKLTMLMFKQISVYEERLGEIPVPKD